jgi:hypothetical protein
VLSPFSLLLVAVRQSHTTLDTGYEPEKYAISFRRLARAKPKRRRQRTELVRLAIGAGRPQPHSQSLAGLSSAAPVGPRQERPSCLRALQLFGSLDEALEHLEELFPLGWRERREELVAGAVECVGAPLLFRLSFWGQRDCVGAAVVRVACAPDEASPARARRSSRPSSCGRSAAVRRLSAATAARDLPAALAPRTSGR